MSDNYTKLYKSLITSTIWQEDNATRILWITLLAMSESDGLVEGSIPGIAKLAGISIPECEKALVLLKAPDKYSRTKEHDGRRIEDIDGGWMILNRAKYRDKTHSRAAYYRDWRNKRNSCATGLQQNETQKEKEIKKEKVKKDYSALFKTFWKNYPERWIPESDKHIKIGKDKAWEQWRKLTEKTQQDIMVILPVFAKTISAKIIPDPWRWLRDKKWKDYEAEPEPEPVKHVRPESPQIVQVTAEQKAMARQSLPTSMQKRLRKET